MLLLCALDARYQLTDSAKCLLRCVLMHEKRKVAGRLAPPALTATALSDQADAQVHQVCYYRLLLHDEWVLRVKFLCAVTAYLQAYVLHEPPIEHHTDDVAHLLSPCAGRLCNRVLQEGITVSVRLA
eukprot:2360350-Amphidinium_carterae.2